MEKLGKNKPLAREDSTLTTPLLDTQGIFSLRKLFKLFRKFVSARDAYEPIILLFYGPLKLGKVCFCSIVVK